MTDSHFSPPADRGPRCAVSGHDPAAPADPAEPVRRRGSDAAAPSSSPLVEQLAPAVTGVEIRPLDPGSCVVTCGQENHVVGLSAQTTQLVVAAWHAGRDDLVGESASEALRPLLTLVQANGSPGPGPLRPPASPPRPRPALHAVLSGDEDLVGALAQRLAPEDPVTVEAWSGARHAVNRAFALRCPLIIAVRGAREADLVDIDRACHDMRVTWMPIELTRGRVWAGPWVTPGIGTSYEDTAARRLAAARDPRVHRALRTPPPGGDQGPAPLDLIPLLDAALDVAERACADWARPGRDRDPGDVLHELFLGPDPDWPTRAEQSAAGAPGESPAGAVVHRRHPVLPMAHRLTRHRAHGIEDLIDERTGLITRIREVRHHPRVPRALVTRQADVADIRAVTPWANNILCQGASMSDPEAARRAAVGESVERYCGNVLNTLEVTWASFDELRRRGAPALDPAELVLYSEAQYRAPGFPFVPLTRDLRVHWVEGRRLRDGSAVLVPASLVYVNWYSAGFAAAPPTNFCAFAGIAAGHDEDSAVAGALEEIIERHATMVWWLNGHPLPRLRGLDAPALDAPLRVAYLSLDNEFKVPVAAAVVHDDDARLVNIGFSARPRLPEAAAKALTEALTLQEGSRDLLRADGLHWKVMADGELNGRAFKPWRADRRYLDDFRPDMHDCDDLMVQQQVYLDPRAAQRMAHLLAPDTERDAGAYGAGPWSRSADHYRRALEGQGIEPIVVDITTADVASTGMHVVRVIAPGTVGNAPAAFPLLGRGRVQSIAVELGWREQPLEEAELNYFPMPHA